MFVVNGDNSIYCTRGDTARLYLKATDKVTGDEYTFQEDDVIRFSVYGKKDCKKVVLQKVFPTTPGTTEAIIELDKGETTIGGVISKPTDYWYDVELIGRGGTQTIIGYDDEGAKVFKLFPEGDEINNNGVPVVPHYDVDIDISATSTNPVQNRAVALELIKIYSAINDILEKLEQMQSE